MEESIDLEYRSISLHAICRDTLAFPYPCLYLLYCQEEEEEEEESEESDEGSPIEKITEMRFVPCSPNDCKTACIIRKFSNIYTYPLYGNRFEF